MRILKNWLVGSVLALAGALAQAAPGHGLIVRLSVPTPVLQGDVDVHVDVSVNNPTRHPVTVLRWQLPGDEVESSLFKITHESGSTVAYTGPLLKRAKPGAADVVRIEAGATLEYRVELTTSYELARNGRYAIQYAGRGGHGAQAAALQSDTLYLWLEGRSSKTGGATQPPAPAAAATTYSSCSASQQTALTAAVNQATIYASGAVSYLNSINSGTARYTQWFGAHTAAREATALAHFQSVQSAFTTQNLAFDCKCKKPSVYAYVYANQPYKIYLCGAFWSAPLAGTDSRAGTLIHEMTHFNVVASTDDYAYGKSAAASLAASDPDKALDNADNHEYFAENTPNQP